MPYVFAAAPAEKNHEEMGIFVSGVKLKFSFWCYFYIDWFRIGLLRQLVWFISMVPRGGFLLLMLRSWYMLISFMLMLLGVVFVFIRSKTSSGFVEQLWGHKVNRQHSQSHVFFSSFDRGGFCTVSSHFSSMRSRNLFCHGSRPLNCYWDLWSWDTALLSRGTAEIKT